MRSSARTRAGVRLVAPLAVLGVAGTVSGSVAPASTPVTDTAPSKPTVVLVHGAWGDGSSWADVAARLQHAGYTVVVPPNPLRGVAADSAYVGGLLRTIQGPIVLVGHSYGGFVVTNAAAGNPDVTARVYVNAYIPDTGDTVAGLGRKYPGSRITPASFDTVPVTGAGPDLYLRRDVFGPIMANDLPRARASVLAAVQRPVAATVLEEPSAAPVASPVPTLALIGTDDHAIPPAAQEFMARRAGAQVTRVAASHLSLLSRPQQVADVIVRAAHEIR